MSRTALDCCIYIRKEVMVWQQGDGKEPRRPKNMYREILSVKSSVFPGTRSRKEDISRSGMYPIPLQFGEIRKKRFR